MNKFLLKCTECGNKDNFIQEDCFVKYVVNNKGEKINIIGSEDKETRYFCPICNGEVAPEINS